MSMCKSQMGAALQLKHHVKPQKTTVVSIFLSIIPMQSLYIYINIMNHNPNINQNIKSTYSGAGSVLTAESQSKAIPNQTERKTVVALWSICASLKLVGLLRILSQS